MSLRLIITQPVDPEAADATASARLIDDYLAAHRSGDVIAAARIEYEIEQYDPSLLDELTGLHQPAAA